MSISRKVNFLLLVVLSSLFALSCKDDGRGANSEAAAKVGNREITIKEVDSLIKQQLDASPGASLMPAELVAARLSVIDTLVQEEAIFLKAQKENLVPDDSKVNQEIQRIKQEARFTEEAYQNSLKQAGLTETEYRNKVRRDLAINALRDKEKTRVNPPTEEEIRKYFEDNKAQFVAERGADISIIVTDPANNGLAADDSIGEAAAEQKINSIYGQLRSGTDFATIASQRSEDQSALRGGRLGFGSEAALRQSFPTRPEIPSRLMSMSAGQYTEPIKDNQSGRWYIFKVNDKRETAQNLTLEDVRQNIVDAIIQQRQLVLWNALMMQARSEADVKNYLADRIVENPQIIVEMRPSALLTQPGASNQSQQPQSRTENENRASQPASNSNSAASSPATGNRRPTASNANR